MVIFFSVFFRYYILHAFCLRNQKIIILSILCAWPQRSCVMSKCPSPASHKLSHALRQQDISVPKAELTHLGEFPAWGWCCAGPVLGGMQAGCPFFRVLVSGSHLPLCPGLFWWRLWWVDGSWDGPGSSWSRALFRFCYSFCAPLWVCRWAFVTEPDKCSGNTLCL